MQRKLMDTNTVKKCSYCHEDKPLSEFGYSSQAKDGREYSCKQCRNAIVRECIKRDIEGQRAKKNERQREARKLKKYIRFGLDKSDECRTRYAANRRVKYFGITATDYSAMNAAQNGLCAICKKGETLTQCFRCNQAIGLMFDDPVIADKAAAYLRKHAPVTPENVVPFEEVA